MCMLIYHPANAEPFALREFEDFHRRNPHGFGVMWRDAAGKLAGRKGVGLRPVDTFAIYRLLKRKHRAMVLHWRFATFGAVDYGNCHPIAVTDDLWYAHNGASIGPATEADSDSVLFARRVLEPTLRDRPWLIHTPWVRRLEADIGGGNRLILWDEVDPAPVIVGESRGVWHRGRWYSNTYAWTVPLSARPNRYRPARRDFSEFLSRWDFA